MKTSPLVYALVAIALFCSSAIGKPPGWSDDYAKALEKAKTAKVNVLLDFTGSDWCGYCMALSREVFLSPKFTAWARKNLVLVEVDYPRNSFQSAKVKKQNAELKTKYQPNGYPTIVLVSPDGTELARTSGYSPGSGPEAFIQKLEGALAKK